MVVGAGGVLHAELLDVKDLADDVGDFTHLLRGEARGIERLLVEVLEAGPIRDGIGGDENA